MTDSFDTCVHSTKTDLAHEKTVVPFPSSSLRLSGERERGKKTKYIEAETYLLAWGSFFRPRLKRARKNLHTSILSPVLSRLFLYPNWQYRFFPTEIEKNKKDCDCLEEYAVTCSWSPDILLNYDIFFYFNSSRDTNLKIWFNSERPQLHRFASNGCLCICVCVSFALYRMGSFLWHLCRRRWHRKARR